LLKHTRDVAFIAGIVYFIQGALGISAITLPLFPRMSDRDADDVVEAVRRVARAFRR